MSEVHWGQGEILQVGHKSQLFASNGSEAEEHEGGKTKTYTGEPGRKLSQELGGKKEGGRTVSA
jgi:hypothetical protein